MKSLCQSQRAGYVWIDQASWISESNSFRELKDLWQIWFGKIIIIIFFNYAVWLQALKRFSSEIICALVFKILCEERRILKTMNWKFPILKKAFLVQLKKVWKYYRRDRLRYRYV